MTAESQQPDGRSAGPAEVGVSVIVSTRGRRGLAWGDRTRFVVGAVHALRKGVAHPHVEIVIMHDETVAAEVLADVVEVGAAGGADSVRLVRVAEAKNAAERLNLGVLACSRQVIVLLDEHTVVQGADFLVRLIAPLMRGDGLTGPRVLRTDGRLLDAGLAHRGRRIEGFLEGLEVDGNDATAAHLVDHECSALGSTCLALTRATFDQVGGLSERFPLLWHVDLARKVAWSGRRVLWVAGATTYRVATPNADPQRRTKEMLALRQRWPFPDSDPFLPAEVGLDGTARSPSLTAG